MPTLADIRERMLQLEPSLGRVVSVSSVAAKYLTSTSLQTGVVSRSKFLDMWMLRSSATDAADRLRVCSDFNSGTGELEHAGVDYVDVTATDEKVELHEHEPTRIDEAVQEALRLTRFKYRTILPARADGRYFLDALDWITQPEHIAAVGVSGSSVLTPNRHLEEWNGYSTAGLLVPDWYTLSGGTFARSETQASRGKYTLAATRSGTDAVVKQTIDLDETGVSADSLRGETLTGVLVASGDGTSVTAKVTVDDGVSPTDATTGITSSTARQEISIAHVIDSAATKLEVYATVEADGVAYIDELYGVFGTLDDTIRRDVAPVNGKSWTWFQQGQPLLMHAPTGRGSQIVIDSRRPYASFNAARVLAGTADADVTDAPIDIIAHGALSVFFGNRAAAQDGTSLDAALAQEYTRKYGSMQANHLYTESNGTGMTDEILSTRHQGRMARMPR